MCTKFRCVRHLNSSMDRSKKKKKMPWFPHTIIEYLIYLAQTGDEILMAIDSLGVLTSALVLSPSKSAVPGFLLFLCNLISYSSTNTPDTAYMTSYFTAVWCRSSNLPHLNPYQSSSIKILPQGMFMHKLKQPAGAEPRPACWGRAQEEGAYCTLSSLPAAFPLQKKKIFSAYPSGGSAPALPLCPDNWLLERVHQNRCLASLHDRLRIISVSGV